MPAVAIPASESDRIDPASGAPSRGRAAGLAIGGSTILAIAAVAHHPVVARSTGTLDVLAAIDHLRVADHLIHGVLIALLLILFAGFAGFVERVGARRPMMQAGLILYATGCLATIGAAVLDGFVIPDIARHYAAAPAGEQQIAFALVTFAGLSVQNLTRIGLILISSGILAWSAALLTRSGNLRLVALAGLLAALVSIVLLTGFTILRPRELIAILAAQAVWNLAAASWLLRLRDI